MGENSRRAFCGAARVSAGISGGSSEKRAGGLRLGFAVFAAGGRAVHVPHRADGSQPDGASDRGRLRNPRVEKSAGFYRCFLRKDRRLAAVSDGVSSGVCGCADHGRRNLRRRCGQREPAGAALRAGTGALHIFAAAAGVLSGVECSQLHQQRNRAFGRLSVDRKTPDPRVVPCRKTSGGSSGLAAALGLAAGPHDPPGREASGRNGSHRRADVERRVGNDLFGGADAQKRAGAGGGAVPGRRICAVLSGNADPDGFSCRVRGILRADGSDPLSGVAGLSGRGRPVHGGGDGAVLGAGRVWNGPVVSGGRWLNAGIETSGGGVLHRLHLRRIAGADDGSRLGTPLHKNGGGAIYSSSVLECSAAAAGKGSLFSAADPGGKHGLSGRSPSCRSRIRIGTTACCTVCGADRGDDPAVDRTFGRWKGRLGSGRAPGRKHRSGKSTGAELPRKRPRYNADPENAKWV